MGDIKEESKYKEVKVMESVYKRNNDISDKISASLKEKGIFCVNVLGAPGVGKTSVLITLIKKLGSTVHVIEGDVEGDFDTKKLNDLGIKTVQINTMGGCHLNAIDVEKVLPDFGSNPEYLFIENIGNLICPANFPVGEHIKLLITSITEGSDKPYKYPLAFEMADILLINKSDLESYVDFDEQFFMEGVKKVNPKLKVVKVSAKKEDGFSDVCKWLKEKKLEYLKES